MGLIRSCCRSCCFLLSALPGLVVLLLAVSPSALNASVLVVCFKVLPMLGRRDTVFPVLHWLANLPAPSTGGPQDVDTRLCEAASRFREHWKCAHIRTLENVRAFKASCHRVLPSLDPALRGELEGLLRAGQLKEATRAQPEKPEKPYADDWRTCASGYARMAEEELTGNAREIYEKTGMATLKPRKVKASEVGEALKRAEVVTFDATGVLPAQMFNVSVPDLARLHDGHDLILHATSDNMHGLEPADCHGQLYLLTMAFSEGRSESLLDWLAARGLVDQVLAWNCRKPWTAQELSQLMPSFQPAEFSFSKSFEEVVRALHTYMGQMLVTHRGLMGSNINVLRLPNWTRVELDAPRFLERFGLGGQADYAHNLLWLGTSPGGIHNDIQDNVLVQITGESDMLVVPANCSNNVDLGIGATVVSTDWLKSYGPDFPFLVIHLKPGDGVAIPSNSMHIVNSLDPWRIGMNFFIEPRYGQMRWPSAPANFYNFASPQHLAMRALWVQTIANMWETKLPGAPTYVVHGERQEFI